MFQTYALHWGYNDEQDKNFVFAHEAYGGNFSGKTLGKEKEPERVTDVVDHHDAL